MINMSRDFSYFVLHLVLLASCGSHMFALRDFEAANEAWSFARLAVNDEMLLGLTSRTW